MSAVSRIVSGVAAVVVVSVIAVSAFSQPGPVAPAGPGGPGMPPGVPGMVPPRPFNYPMPGMMGDEGQIDTLSDPLSLVRRLMPTQEQRIKLEEMSAARNAEMARLRDDLNKQYVDKVKAILTDEQKTRFDALQTALAAYRAKVKPSEDALTALGGPALVQFAKISHSTPNADVMRFLDLTPEQNQSSQQLRTDMVQEYNKARVAIPPVANTEDREAMAKRSADLRAAMDKARADFDQKVTALLTKEQLEKRTKILDAVAAYAKAAGEGMADVQQAMSAGMNRPMPINGMTITPMPPPTAPPPAPGALKPAGPAPK